MGLLPIPFVFGPVGGGQTAPRSLRRFFATRWRAEVARTLVVRGLLPVLPTARLGAGRADLVLAANHETARLLRRLGARSVHPMPDMGVSQDEIAAEPARPSEDGQFRLLWVGRFQGHKGLPLALRAVAALPADSPVRLRIVGYGPLEEQLSGWIEDLELGDRVDLVGRVPYTEMRGEYRAADALLFTSIRESGGIQMLEALAQGCPVIALDHQGPRVLISDDVGVRTPVGDGPSTIAGLAAGIQQLVEHPEQRRRMSHNGIALARHHTWAGKARTVTSLYGEVARSVVIRRSRREAGLASAPSMPTANRSTICSTEYLSTASAHPARSFSSRSGDVSRPATAPAYRRGSPPSSTTRPFTPSSRYAASGACGERPS
jgi:glycosyltransferase involved in cell wall biosynthesis